MPKHTRRSANQGQALIEQQHPVGPEFCQRHDVGYASFCQWHKRLSDSAPVAHESLPTFLAVEPPAQPLSSPQWLVELQISTDMVLRIGKS